MDALVKRKCQIEALRIVSNDITLVISIRLKKQFIPKINPIGSYSARQLALTLACRVLVDGEIEAYFNTVQLTLKPW